MFLISLCSRLFHVLKMEKKNHSWIVFNLFMLPDTNVESETERKQRDEKNLKRHVHAKGMLFNRRCRTADTHPFLSSPLGG